MAHPQCCFDTKTIKKILHGKQSIFQIFQSTISKVMSLTQEQAEEFWTIADADGNGQMKVNELKHAMQTKYNANLCDKDVAVSIHRMLSFFLLLKRYECIFMIAESEIMILPVP